jgi:Fe-S-cluster containining protein
MTRTKRPKRPRRSLHIVDNVMTPRADEDGTPRSVGPYLPVVRACDLCPARCCRCQVKVSLPDALHFCTTMGLPLFTPHELIVAQPGPRSFRVEIDPRALAPNADWQEHIEIVLRRVDGVCASLLRVGGYERCGAYAARPMTCRIYPLSWEEGDRSFGPTSVLCAVPYAVTPSVAAQLEQDVVRYHRFWAIHEEIAKEWHARPSRSDFGLDAFLSFVIPRTADRLGVDPGPTLAEGNPDARLYQAMVASKRIR